MAGAWLISWADGTSAVGKIVNGAAPDLFRTEADGLAALRGTGHLATPDVLAVTDRLLLLEALAPRDDSAGSWEAFGRDRPDGPNGCPCCTCVSCSAASRTSAPRRPMTWDGYAPPSARSTRGDPCRRVG